MTSSAPSPNETSLTNRDLTVAEMVLVATAEAANWTTEPVRYGAIVVRAWKTFPVQFALQGFPEFPDASDIHKPLYRTLKQRELVESVGQKTFRLTDLGLSTAKSIATDDSQVSAWRRTLSVDVCDDQTTQSVIRALVDAASQEAEVVATRLLGSALAIRFPADDRDHRSEIVDFRLPPVVGDTAFSVLIPMTLEELQAWISSGSATSRRALIVRDSVLPFVERILAEAELSIPTASYGVETFLGLMIDGMAAYDRLQIAAITRSMIDRYNEQLPLALPRIRLNVVACSYPGEG